MHTHATACVQNTDGRIANTRHKLLPWASVRARHRQREGIRTDSGVHGSASRGKGGVVVVGGGRHLLEAAEETLLREPGEEREGRDPWWEGSPAEAVSGGGPQLLAHLRDEGACGCRGLGIN